MECRGCLSFLLSFLPIGAGVLSSLSDRQHATTCLDKLDSWVARRVPSPIHFSDRTLVPGVRVSKPNVRAVLYVLLVPVVLRAELK